MFVVASKHRFWWPVTVRMPDPEKPGQLIEATFQMQFETLPMERARALDAERNALPADERTARLNDWLFEVAKDWHEVIDADRAPIPFSREAFAAFLELAWHRNAVIEAYGEAMSGQAARLGNSAGLPAH